MDVYDTFSIVVEYAMGRPSLLSTQDLIQHWKCIDTALAGYTSISCFEIDCDGYLEDAALPQDNEYTCIADLFRDLLPKFTSRVPPETGCHTSSTASVWQMCAYHK